MEGAISAIREEGFVGKLQLIVNELTPESRNALSEDIVTMAIHTPLPALCSELVTLMITAMSKPKKIVPGERSCPSTSIFRRISEIAARQGESLIRDIRRSASGRSA